MALNDTTSAELTATAAEIEEALRSSISREEQDAFRLGSRASGLSREVSQRLRAYHNANARALKVLLATHPTEEKSR